MQYQVVFQPAGCRGTVDGHKNLLAVARETGVDIAAPCGGTGVCGKCKVKIEDGFFANLGIASQPANVSPLTEQEQKLLSREEITGHYRLACCATIRGDALLYVPEQSRAAKQVILENGREKAVVVEPAIAKYGVQLNKPTLADHRDDFVRIKEALHSGLIQFDKELDIDYRLLTGLPGRLRQNNWQVNVVVWRDSEIIDVQPAGEQAGLYGIAIDIGTTTIAAYLCDLTTGAVLSRDSLVNSQVPYGDDVLSRVTFCMLQADGLERLNKLIIDDINTLVCRLTAVAGIKPESVLEMVLAGNTVMHHLVLNIDPQYIGRVPFVSAIRQAVDVKARDLGIAIAPGGYIHCLPVEAGFVGADNVAVLLAEEPYKQDELVLVIDIGTNGEINFGNKDGILSASSATGPALEGAQIKFGMRAAPGAIERVSIDPVTQEPAVTIIKDAGGSSPSAVLARGICGSGIIDAVAAMFKAGIIRPDGTFNKKISSPRIRPAANGKFEYVLVWAQATAIGQDITITQKDVRAVQLAKAALYAGTKILMRKKGVDKITEVILAGAFGSFIDKENALVIGLFPDCDLARVTAVGNAAGEGAKLALLNCGKRTEAQRVAAGVQFVETAADAEFKTNFYDAMYFPHAKDVFPHVQHILAAIPQ